MRVQAAPNDPIARYVYRLDAHLDGAVRAKRDVLREVRHGLDDAAAAYEREGLDPTEARWAAVADFGEPDEIAGEFQAELTARHTNTVLLFLAALGPVSEVVSRILWSNGSGAVDTEFPVYLGVLASTIDVLGWGASLAAVVCLLWLGMAARWSRFSVAIARTVGVSVVAWLVVLVGGGVVLSLASPVEAHPLYTVVGLPIVGAQIYLGWLALRCVLLAGRANRLDVA